MVVKLPCWALSKRPESLITRYTVVPQDKEICKCKFSIVQSIELSRELPQPNLYNLRYMQNAMDLMAGLILNTTHPRAILRISLAPETLLPFAVVPSSFGRPMVPARVPSPLHKRQTCWLYFIDYEPLP